MALGDPVPTRFPVHAGKTVVAIVGDSKTSGGTIGSTCYKWTKGAAGYLRNASWGLGDPVGSFTTLNTGALGFIETPKFGVGVASSDSIVVQWDGIKSVSVNIAGEGFGTPVDVTNGGWFTCYSLGGTKALHFASRWDYKPGAATSDTLAAPTLNSGAYCGSFGCWAMPSLAKLGMADLDIYTFGIVGDTLNAILRRNWQVIALNPDIVLIEAGVNGYTDTNIDDLAVMIRQYNQIGATVIVSTIIPLGGTTTTNAKKLAAREHKILNIKEFYPDLICTVFDSFSNFANPQSTGGDSLITLADYGSDKIHQTFSGLANNIAAPLATAISKFLPTRLPAIRSVANAYDVTVNPYGNQMLTTGQFVGTAGTKGTNPVPSGVVPTGWLDIDVGNSAFTSVVYTDPANVSPIARTDIPNGNWMRMAVNTAGTSGSARELLLDEYTSLTLGVKYQFKGTLRVSAASNLRLATVYALFLSSSNKHVATYALFNTGTYPIGVSSVVADTGPMYLASEPVQIPADTTGNWRIIVHVECGVGGSAIVDMADFELCAVP